MVIGIDPGTATVGFALVEGSRQKPVIVDYGVLSTLPAPVDQMPFRLLELGNDLEHILKTYKPTLAIVEDLFFFRNVTTVISVAQSRGMTLYLLAKYGVRVVSKTPLQVKQTLCGYGRAPKKQVQEMVKRIYGLEEIPRPDDAADALALALFGLK